MRVKIDFQLNRRFGVVERLIFRLILNGFNNAREMELALPLFSDAVIANAVRHLANEQIISVDVETGKLSLSEAIVAFIAMCHQQSFEIELPFSLEIVLKEKGIEVFDNDNSMPGTIRLKGALIQELLPNVKLDFYRYSLDFIILPDGGISNE